MRIAPYTIFFYNSNQIKNIFIKFLIYRYIFSYKFNYKLFAIYVAKNGYHIMTSIFENNMTCSLPLNVIPGRIILQTQSNFF